MQADARELSPKVLHERAPEGFDTVLSDMVGGVRISRGVMHMLCFLCLSLKRSFLQCN